MACPPSTFNCRRPRVEIFDVYQISKFGVKQMPRSIEHVSLVYGLNANSVYSTTPFRSSSSRREQYAHMLSFNERMDAQ